ncbi:transglutaminase family protein [Chloroflexus sp.]|uniref:transglutaminase family protein n=1 Tax=Chloroflexus sp. TaxID=1904827 RepID=UPI002ADE23FB|nr:transglutaminase family protein [Chloroflexus sp.]
MYYSILHKTRFRYSAPVTESQTEVRMCPCDEGYQRLVEFHLTTAPFARINHYRDWLGNEVYHFDVAAAHRQLLVIAEAVVQMFPIPPLPDKLDNTTWQMLDLLAERGEWWDFLMPSHFIQMTPALLDLARELGVERRTDPLSLLRDLTHQIAQTFAYAPQTTRVDSPIDEALLARRGVCQDFAHIMIALVRRVGIPCRYVSGYLFHRTEDHDRSEEDATHAWVEAFLPELGWIGFDPTNDLIAAERHIRVAVGRDYADVPPTRGIYRGQASSQLEVGVKVLPAAVHIDEAEILPQVTTASVQAELAAQQQQQ